MRYQILSTVSSVVQNRVFGRYAPMFQKKTYYNTKDGSVPYLNDPC